MRLGVGWEREKEGAGKTTTLSFSAVRGQHIISPVNSLGLLYLMTVIFKENATLKLRSGELKLRSVEIGKENYLCLTVCFSSLSFANYL